MKKQPMKRMFRNDMSDQQKRAISMKLQGRTLTQSTKDKISKAMQDYWASLPLKPATENPYENNTTEQSTNV